MRVNKISSSFKHALYIASSNINDSSFTVPLTVGNKTIDRTF